MGVDLHISCDCAGPSSYRDISADLDPTLDGRSIFDADNQAVHELAGQFVRARYFAVPMVLPRSVPRPQPLPRCEAHDTRWQSCISTKPYWKVREVLEVLRGLGPDRFPHLYLLLVLAHESGGWLPPQVAEHALADLQRLEHELYVTTTPCLELIDLRTERVVRHLRGGDQRERECFGDWIAGDPAVEAAAAALGWTAPVEFQVSVVASLSGLDVLTVAPDGRVTRQHGETAVIPAGPRFQMERPWVLGARMRPMRHGCSTSIWSNFGTALQRAVDWGSPISIG